MDLLFFVIISFVLLLVSATKGYFVLYPLLISMAILIVILLNRRFQLKSLIQMAIMGSQKSFSVIGILLLIRIDVKISMAISVIVGIVIAVFVQGYSLIEVVNFMLIGFKLTSPSSLTNIMTGGGVISMLKISTVVIVSTAFAGIFEGTRTLEFIKAYLTKARTRGDLFLGTTVIGILSAAFGCTQTLAILLTHQLVEDKYQAEELDNYQLAVDLENTVVVISPLIPWNIAGLVPATVLMTDSGFIPYAFYLYLIPLFNLIQIKLAKSSKVDGHQ